MRNGISHLLFFISVWGVNLVVFIVSDQRIATENFEKGKIYKVVFLDESIFYGVCIGIGSNFVMLSGNISGYLFPLTMETASQVESIDLYTPVEPEPPVPPMTNLLQYQTGVPPFTFNTSGTNLWSYYIKGNTVQNGTPTPTNPVDVVGVGTLDGTAYKIPILSNSQTTNVYLGEVETRRKIKKLVLSSSQNWQLQSINSYGIANFYFTTTNDFIDNTSIISNYFTRQTTTIGNTTAEGMLIALSNNVSVYIRINSQTASTAQEFKNWLDDLSEEAAIWYVLATEETAVVNEPLMKIGDYADSLTSEQAGIQIPTIVGDDTISVSTTVQPSEMQIVYKIADR